MLRDSFTLVILAFIVMRMFDLLNKGACILGSQWYFSKLKTLTGFKRAHIEPMRGKPEDSLVYCTKQDLEPFVYGTLPQPGKGRDLQKATKAIQDGSTLADIATGEVDVATAVVKYFRGLTVLRSLVQPVRTSAPIVAWIWGATGTGKTRSVFELARRLVAADGDIWISSGGLRWFDGYDGQSVAIFDDFRAKDVGSFAFLLRLLDRYPLRVEFKGGFVNWVPKFIFITCPSCPEDCFAKRKEHIPEDINQLNRRIHHVEEFDKSNLEHIEEFVCRFISRIPGWSEATD